MGQYLKKKKISNTFQRRVMNYFKQLWKNGMLDTIEDEQETVGKMSLALQNELTWQDKGRMFDQIPFMKKNISQSTLSKLVGVVKEQHFFPGDIIATSKDEELALRYIFKGSVNMNSNNKQAKVLQTLNENSYFGLEQLFQNKPYPMNYQSNDFTIIYTLKKKDFLDRIIEEKSDYDTYQWLKYSESFANPGKCYSCFQPTHQTFQCPLISYVPNVNLFLKRLCHNKPQERQNELYRKNPKFNSLANIKFQQKRLQDLEQFLQGFHLYHFFFRLDEIDMEQQSWGKLEFPEDCSPSRHFIQEDTCSPSRYMERNQSVRKYCPSPFYFLYSLEFPSCSLNYERKFMDCNFDEDFDKLNKSKHYNKNSHYLRVIRRLRQQMGDSEEKKPKFKRRMAVLLNNKAKK